MLGSSAREPVATVNGTPVSLLEGDLNNRPAILPDLGANDIDIAGSQNFLQNALSYSLHQFSSTGNVAIISVRDTFGPHLWEPCLEQESAFNENVFPMPLLESVFGSHRASSPSLGASNLPAEGQGLQHDHHVSRTPFVFSTTGDATTIGGLGGTLAQPSPNFWRGLGLEEPEDSRTALNWNKPSTEATDDLE